jgi:hypothetical protein
MKKVLYLLMLAVFVFSVSAAVAGELPGAKVAQAGMNKPAKSVNCCQDGKCKKAASADLCSKLGGKVVKDCQDCK